MIYTDGIHLVADSLPELHAFAKRIGLQYYYYHGAERGHPHYDLVTKMGRPAKCTKDKDLWMKEIKMVSSKEVLRISKSIAKVRRTGKFRIVSVPIVEQNVIADGT